MRRPVLAIIALVIGLWLAMLAIYAVAVREQNSRPAPGTLNYQEPTSP